MVRRLTSMTDTSKASVTRSRGFALGPALLGVLVGIVLFLAITYITVLPMLGNFASQPVIPIVMAAIAGGSVFAGRQWPAIAMVAGVLVTFLALIFSFSGVSTAQPSTGDVMGTIAFGSASGFPLVIGVVLFCAAVVTQLQQRRS